MPGALSVPVQLSTLPTFRHAYAPLQERPAMDPRFIDDLARRLAAAVSPGLSALRRDLEDNFKAVLQSGLTRLDLVSRQEFDVQAAVLRRTREKLDALEARLAALEKGK
jgi:ubiquinone biosynthesis accessory factor UbiK